MSKNLNKQVGLENSIEAGVGLKPELLIQSLKSMYVARQIDEKAMRLLKQGKVFFHIGVSGHEAIQVASAMNLRPGYDWAYPYYRDWAFVYQLGVSLEELFYSVFGRADCPATGGRQMPAHFGKKELRIITQSSPTGTQYLQAVGTAMGCVRDGTDEVVYVSGGDGSTSEGEFHEALNWASKDKLPVIFVIQNNRYAISVPIYEQTAGASVAKIGEGFFGLGVYEIDGTDFFQSYQTVKKAVERARAGQGPTMIVANVVRLIPHSSSDDHRKYRSPEELERERLNDPILKMENLLVKEGILTNEEIQRIYDELNVEIERAIEHAERKPYASPETVMLHVYAPEETRKLKYEASVPSGKPIVMVDAINHALHEEMELNPKMVVYGEDIADPKGGVFTATKGLTTRFGKSRAFNSPLAEASIVGTAIGLAVKGYKPVVEIQFGDYIWPAMMQIRDELAPFRYRSNGNWSAPVVIRVPVGGYIHGGHYHSQNIEGFFAHLPGIFIAYPSNAADAKGLLKTACRIEDPVLFLEHKALYRSPQAMSPEPDKDYLLPFGKAQIKKPGKDATIVTWGLMVYKSLEAVKIIEQRYGVEIEVIDIRTINPLDKETILESVKKTSRVLIVHEDTLTAGFGAEISAMISEEAFEYLDAPIKRVAGIDVPGIPYAPTLEDAALPQTDWIVKALDELLKF
ncbi:2-oxoisovalerate dehydrogenase E1 component [Candidatus Thermokryptus mobilis]|uniref:2-oxoisovalerate dehydrogenase E1 component n=1 Tax=Candidatus Thermokryptus mobilis TaxID=1643428 RepID=A0A0S4MN75_9BACT|nr:dehydrogenase E1 component subunit alpha/beta [Candidatus Thermokryptus mobilis]CUU00519.1 2-oxoisovalerate dehydrogenase E1 component [Candidatus Thermokryptus mobilis]